MSDYPTRAIILAAGRGVRRLDVQESTPTPLVETPQGQAVLDKQIDSLQRADLDDIICLAGYHIEKLVDANAEIDYYYDSDWKEDGHVAALSRKPEVLSGDLVLTTGETLFERAAIEQLCNVDADVAVAVTRFPSRDVAREAARTLNESELVAIDDGQLHMDLSENLLPNARLLGLASLSPAGADVFRSVISDIGEDDVRTPSFSDILAEVSELNGGIQAVDVGDTVQQYDEKHALARFLLGTKADTLERLDGLVQQARVLDQVTFDVVTWERTPADVIDSVRSTFPDGPVVVRSSAVSEDGWRDSLAGAFHSELDVDPSDETGLSEAIDRVVASLRDGSGQDKEDQVLVQPQVENVEMSGVAFTRELNSGGPYTVVNYDDTSGRTDTVTAGKGGRQKTVYFHHDLDGAGQFEDHEHLAAVKSAIKELRELLDDPPLDIEFAVDGDDVTILQVRPLAVHTTDDRYDSRDVSDEVKSVATTVTELQEPRPLLLGEGTVLGVMPDWNPAEMIGTDPDPLALSLYRYLITDDVWARARAASGYRDVRPVPLMVTLAGRPYIDTLADFNSFLPASLPDDLGEKLVNHYVDRLARNPELQDKVEFEIAFTCLDFSFDTQRNQLELSGFSHGEIETLRNHLRELTDPIVTGDVAPIQEQHDRLLKLGRRRHKLLDTELESWPQTIRCVRQLLDDTREYGTLPFSILARYAFIGTAFLNSLVEREAITEQQRETVAEGVPTIAQELADDMERLRNGDLDSETFLSRYGHLRPGTYDICSVRYDEDPTGYFDVDSSVDLNPLALDRRREPAVASWESNVSPAARSVFEDAREDIQALINEESFTFTVDTLFEFISQAIPMRELAKFEFTRSLSAALTLLRRGADTYLNLAPDQVAALTLDELLGSVTQNLSPVLNREFERSINHNRKRARIQSQVQLPPVISDADDVLSFEVTSEQPNYITNERTRAETVRIEEHDDLDRQDLNGRIVLIPSADPGFDWIFGADIAGLVTKYGGVASHMAIRAAEFGLPAAIGCGEVVFEDVTEADVLELDCAGERLREVR